MLTPQDIQDVKFTKSMKGYDKDQVEDFLDKVHDDYTALYKENAALKSKMRVLVDKIEEYRSVDEQMRQAFYSAQVASKETIAKAQSEAEQILSGARQEAETRVNDIRLQIEAEEKRLQFAKQECTKYTSMMKEMLSKNISFIDILMEKSAVQISMESDGVQPVAEKAGSFEIDIKAQEDAEDAGVSEEDKEDTREMEPAGIMRDLEASVEKKLRDNVPSDPDDSGRIIISDDLRFGKGYKDKDDEY